MLALEEKLGPILWQLPPQLAFDAERLEDVLRAAAAHDRGGGRARARATTSGCGTARGSTSPIGPPARHALEVRHETFLDPAFVALLARHDVALVVADTAGKWPYLEDVTSDFVYVRLHGDKELYVSGYTGGRARRVGARAIAAWQRTRGRDVYVYFDNDVKVRAPFDAMNLAARLGHGDPVTFPLAARRAVEAARGIELPRRTWDRWRFGPRRDAGDAR